MKKSLVFALVFLSLPLSSTHLRVTRSEAFRIRELFSDHADLCRETAREQARVAELLQNQLTRLAVVRQAEAERQFGNLAATLRLVRDDLQLYYSTITQELAVFRDPERISSPGPFDPRDDLAAIRLLKEGRERYAREGVRCRGGTLGRGASGRTGKS